MSDAIAARTRLAAQIGELADLRWPATAAAFAMVAREDFLGPGPWAVWDTTAWQYVETPDRDPRHVYRDVPIAISRTRLLNNGQPSFVAKLIDALNLRRGERVLHVGCGTGYYSAILATIVGAGGRVTAVELDAEIAASARANVAALAQVTVVHADGCTYDPGPVDAMLINAGATHPCPLWLDSLATGGRLILPLVRWPTDPAESGAAGSGVVIKVTRDDDQYHACFVSSVTIFPCIGAADAEADGHLAEAMRRLSDIDAVRSVRRDRHESEPSCWLHGDGFCLSLYSPNLQ